MEKNITHWSKEQIFGSLGCNYCVQNYPTNGKSSPHSHDFYEFGVVTDGNGIYENEKGVFTLIQGDVLAVKPGKLHAYTSDEKLRISNIMFMPEFLDGEGKELKSLSGIRALLEEQRKLHLPHNEYCRVEKIIYATISEQKMRSPGFHCICKGFLYELLTLFGRLNIREEEPIPNPESELRIGVNRAIRYMEKHYASPIVLKTLTVQAQMSRSKFCMVFKMMTGCTCGEYLKEIRIEKAKELLSSTNLQQSQIALQCGFCDSSHFGRIFRERTGSTPLEYRRCQIAENLNFFRRHDMPS